MNPSQTNMDRLVQRIETIPTIPVVGRKVVELAGDEEAVFRDLVEIIEKDQALAAKVLRVANSAFYGFYVAGGNYTAPALVRDARTTIIASPPTNTYHPFGGTPHTAELRIYGNNLTGIYNEGEADEAILTTTDSTHSGAGQVEVIVGQATGWFDVFFVRKYVEPEPSHGSWGAEEGVSPSVITTAVSSITFNSAFSGGNVTSDGGAPVTARGVCWSTSANPTTADTCTSDGTGTGAYTSSLTGLLPATTYNVRAYATNAGGTAYGDNLTFETLPLPIPIPTLSEWGIMLLMVSLLGAAIYYLRKQATVV